jgi:hypothetical protein
MTAKIPTRKELSSFLKSHDLVAKFEDLFRLGVDESPTTIVNVTMEAAAASAQITALESRIATMERRLSAATTTPIPQPLPRNLSGFKYGGDPLNYATFERDGTLVFNGDATYWVDISFPVIIRTTGANIPTIANMTSTIAAPQWAIGDTTMTEGTELIHAWKEGSTVEWHLHMITNGTDGTNRYVKWEILWSWADKDGILASPITTAAEILIPANTPSLTHIMCDIGPYALSSAHIIAHVFPRLSRVALTTGGLTGPSHNPWCWMLQMHAECDTLGSRQEHVK